VFRLQGCYNAPPYKNLVPRFRGEENQESVSGTSIGQKKIKIAGAKESHGLQVAHPSTDEPRKYT
jgi:hypothetical protein